MKTIIKSVLLGLMLCISSAHAVMITGSFTGAWFDEDAPGQGFLLQVVEVEGEPTAVVYWFTFDPTADQVWLVGQAPVDGDSVTIDMFSVQGGALDMNGFDFSNLELIEWGELTLSFDDCDAGLAEYAALDPAIGSGSFNLDRLTESLGDECTGGVSDNVGQGEGAKIYHVEFDNTGEEPDANGRVKYEENANWSKLKVRVKDLPFGVYELNVDGETVGEFDIDRKGSHKLFFSSPEKCGWELLDFDPLNAEITVEQDGVVFLTTEIQDEDIDDDATDDANDDGDSGDDDSELSCDSEEDEDF